MKSENQKGINHKVVEIRRVCKVGKGGKSLNFRALVVVGNQKGIVGIGIGKASEVLNAIKKGQYKAIQNRIQIAMTRTKTIPHRSEASFGAAHVMLRPAAPGSGVIAGGAGRAVLELAGIKNILAKQLRSKNKINNARATLLALNNLRFITTTAKLRGLSLERLTGRKPSQDSIEGKKTPEQSGKTSAKFRSKEG
uniref:ribosomal protein S5 n=1 Tax=Lietzensia polymorpha TaxID=2962110 RepID=UPI00218219C5|nr:ribosomal protein S5 [Lietzensia polymorpha]UVI61218.1 ribosomal protein S5 [Lietzensia polymorpha]